MDVIWWKNWLVWPAISAYLQIITWALLIEYHFQIVCMLTLLHGKKVWNGSKVWVHICKAECKAKHRNKEVNYKQHIRDAVSNAKLHQTLCDSGYFDCLPPLVIFVQQWSRLCHNIWVIIELNLNKRKTCCFHCIIRTSVVTAGAL